MTDIADLREFLRSQPKAPDTRSSNRLTVKLLLSEIRVLKNKGYTFDRIAALLAQKGVSITGNTLRNYFYSLTSKKSDTDSDTAPSKKSAAGREREPLSPDSPTPSGGPGERLGGRVNPVLD